MIYVKLYDEDVMREVQVVLSGGTEVTLPAGAATSEEPFPNVPLVPRNKWDWDLAELMK